MHIPQFGQQQTQISKAQQGRQTRAAQQRRATQQAGGDQFQSSSKPPAQSDESKRISEHAAHTLARIAETLEMQTLEHL